VTKKEIRQVADLRGKKIATTSFGGLIHSMTIEVLKHYGLDQKDVVIWPVGGTPLRVAALINGQVDASILSAPGDIVIAGKGFKVLLDVGTLIKVPIGGLSTTVAKIKENRPEVAKVFRALVQATKFFIDPRNKAEAITYLATHFKLEKSAAEELYPRLVSALPPTTMVDRDTVKSFIAGAVNRGITNKPLEPEQVVDFSFAKELGTKVQ
jgi:NitT/TauT family transport system substrate-binding protein